MSNKNLAFSGVPNLLAGFGSSLQTMALNPAHHSLSPSSFPSTTGGPNVQAGFGGSLQATSLNPAQHSSSPSSFPSTSNTHIKPLFPSNVHSNMSFDMRNNDKENICGNRLGARAGHVLYSNKDSLPEPTFLLSKADRYSVNIPSPKNENKLNLLQCFEEAPTFKQGLLNLRNHTGDFTFTFNSVDQLENSSQNSLRLKQDLEICRKVQYEILQKLKHFNIFQKRGMLCLQNTTAAVKKQTYWFSHQEKPRKIVHNRIAQ